MPDQPAIPKRRRALSLPIPDTLVAVLLILENLAPLLLAGLVFVGGLVLLVESSHPETGWRMALMRDLVPLPFSEASHLSSSLAGLALIVLARGLALRMAQARIAATVVLLAGAIFSLARGLNWEDAILLTLVAGALTLSRRAFHRRGDWRSFRPTPMFLVLVIITLLAVTVIGYLGYRNINYRTELWWSFAWRGDAPRFLRATLVLAIATAALTLDAIINRPLTGRAKPEPIPPQVTDILQNWPDSSAQAALSGDKRFLVSPDGTAFLMYAISGRSWVCLGGPVGAAEASEALIWKFAELADRAGGRPVFYNVGPEAVTRLLDLGQAILKTGEVARVDLNRFTLEGPDRKHLRYALSRAARDGLRFVIVSRGAEARAVMDELRTVSEAWLATRKGREKGFSVGRFDPDYLAQFDIATLRHGDRIVAFANIWSGGQQEMSIDLMRHLPGESPVVMEALMTEILNYAGAQGYQWFNLGGAPLSGLSSNKLAPVWARIGTVIYRRGDEFYSFEGLRAYKEKFGPVWTPRYLTCPGGLSVARALIDVTLLISRSPLADVEESAQDSGQTGEETTAFPLAEPAPDRQNP